MTPLNILYLHSHDTGRYVQPYGHAIATPNIQRLAEEGVLFRQAFCAAPTCSPSRAALLTGQWAHSSGMLGLAHRGWALDDYSRHLVHTLRGACGHRSVLFGVQHVAAWDREQVIGYDEIVPEPDKRAAKVAPKAAAFLRARPAEPFFMDVGFSETHRAFPPLDHSDEARYVQPPAPLPDSPATREDMARYLKSARALDDGIGQVLHALDESGLADRTLVILTTDHGIAFPHMKCNLTDHGIGVMLVVRGPGAWRGGRTIDAMVSHVDVFPTLCEELGIQPQPWLQGVSLMPLLRGDRDAVRDELFAEVTYHAAYEPQRAVRTRRWKYIRRFDGRPSAVYPNVDDGESKTAWHEAGWRDQPVAEEALYDLAFDPQERCNLAGEPRASAALDEMRGRLDRWMRDTDDPLLRGPVELPPGAWTTDADDYSPAPKKMKPGA